MPYTHITRNSGDTIQSAEWNAMGNALQPETTRHRVITPAGNGATDETSIFTSALASGMPVDIQPGTYAVNLVITTSTVRLAGLLGNNANGVRLIPYDTTKPVIQIGNNSGTVDSVVLENLLIDGGATGQIGLSLPGGARKCFYRNLRIQNFTAACLSIGSGANATLYQYFDGLALSSTAIGTNGALLKLDYGTSFVAAIFIENAVIEGQVWGGGTNGAHCIQNDSVSGLYLTATWIQAENNQGVLLNNTRSNLPKIQCAAVAIDSNTSTDTLVEVTYNSASNHSLGDHLRGSVTVDGKFKLSDGTLIPSSGNLIPYQSLLDFPAVNGKISILPAAHTGYSEALNFQNDTGNGLNINTGNGSGQVRVRANGVVQLQSFTTAGRPTASSYTGGLIYVSDGAAGSKFQGSDGTSWVSLG
jgi:hypothetical protein